MFTIVDYVANIDLWGVAVGLFWGVLLWLVLRR